MNIHKRLPPQFTKKDWVAFDVEMFEQSKIKLHRPHGRFACVTCCADGENVYFMDDPQRIPVFIDRIYPATLVGMNMSYDITQLRPYAEIPPKKRVWDIMLIERLMYSGYYETFSLAAMARRYFDIYMEKDTRKEFIKGTEITDEMIHYACDDPLWTWKISQEQRKSVRKSDLKIWKEADRPAMWAILDFKGFPINSDDWLKIAKESDDFMDEMKAKFNANPNSTQQMVAFMNKEFRMKLKASNEKVLKTAIKKSAKPEFIDFANRLIKYRKMAKKANTYGESFIKTHCEDGFIHANYNVSEAETGRTSSTSPNMQNIPKRETLAYRRCFQAKEGYVIIVADWSQQEPRIACFLSKDKKMRKIFQSGKDIYIETGKEILGEEVSMDDERRETILKPIVLGSCYGLTPWGLARQYDVPVDEAEIYMDLFFDAFKGLDRWRSRQQRASNKTVSTIYGRRFYLNKYSRQWLNNALNAPVQGSAADAMKILLGKLHKRWPGESFPVVGMVHDEVILHVHKDKAEEYARIIKHDMIQVAEEMHPGIPGEAEVRIGKSWAKN